jgi:hypothetical protein
MTNTARKLLLGLLRGGGAAVTYLFRDEFTTDDAAPLTSPRTAEPGPGTLTITQTDGGLSISGGKLIIDGTPVTGWNRQGAVVSTTRAAGRALFMNYNRSANGTGDPSTLIGWMTVLIDSGSQGLAAFSSSDLVYVVDGAFTRLGSYTLGVDYTIAHVLWAAGSLLFIKAGSGDWACRWVELTANTSGVLGGIANQKPVGTSEFIYVRDLPEPFATAHSTASVNVSSPTDATEYTGNADAIIDITVTAPGVLDGSATTRCGFYYRTDADLTPAWHCYTDGLGAFRVDSIDAAGTRTNRIAAAGVIAGGATLTLRVICAGTKHNAYTLSGANWTKRGNEVDVSLNDTVTRIIPSVPAGYTAANLRSYPYTSAIYQSELNRGN